jgi:4-hydroxybenzoate polyprenyltransferase
MKILSDISACARLLADVVSYRIRKREMANLFATASIMIALHNEKLDIVVRLIFGAVLNALIYLINDYYDIEIDFNSGTRERDKVLFLRDHRRQALASMIILFLGLAAWAVFYYSGLLLPLLGGVGLCWLYSARLKRVPIADILVMAAWGGVMPAAGIFLDSRVGWLLLGQLALFAACFEVIQTLRDKESDGLAGIRTTAVFLGERRTRILLKVLICATALYCVLVLHYIFGLFVFIAAVIPVHVQKMDAYWNRIRLIFGLVWLAVLVQFYIHGSPLSLFYAKIIPL